jgi:hypothetical protein
LQALNTTELVKKLGEMWRAATPAEKQVRYWSNAG